MSKKTNAEKRKRARIHVPKRKARKGRPNPAGLLSDRQMVEIAENLAWGHLGCTILRSLGIKPIELVVTIQEGLASTDNDGSPEAQTSTEAKE